MTKKRILVVEDDKDISEMIRYNLEKENYKIVCLFNGEDVLNTVKRNPVSLIILDIMLPGMDGLEVCKALGKQSQTEHIPIIILSAKSQESDKVLGLELGADDYITKPFSPRELLARIKAVLRRNATQSHHKRVEVGKLIINQDKHQVMLADKLIPLTVTEFKLLHFLANKPGIVISRESILDNVFSYDSTIYDRTVDAHIKSLRKKLGKYKDYIQTVRGMGYKFKEIIL